MSALFLAGIVVVGGFVFQSGGAQSEMNEGGLVPSTLWEGFDYSMEGEAGDWTLVFQELPGGVDYLEYDLEVQVTARGDGSSPTALLLSPPSVIIDQNPGLGYRLWPYMDSRGPLFTDAAGGDLRWGIDTPVTRSVNGAEFAAIVFLVGSNVPWSADMRMTLSDGLAGVGPDHVSEGKGAVFLHDAEWVLSVTEDGALVGEVILDALLDSPGWTHLQYKYDPLPGGGEYGVWEYEIAFPGGHQAADTGEKMWVDATPIFGHGSKSRWFEFFGAVNDQGGEFTSRLSYLHTQSRLEVGLIHLPIEVAELPDLFQSYAYKGVPGAPF